MKSFRVIAAVVLAVLFLAQAGYAEISTINSMPAPQGNCWGVFSGGSHGSAIATKSSGNAGSGSKGGFVSAGQALSTYVNSDSGPRIATVSSSDSGFSNFRTLPTAQEWKDWKAWKTENDLLDVSFSEYKDYTGNYAETLTFSEYQEYKEFISEYSADGAAPVDQGLVSLGGDYDPTCDRFIRSLWDPPIIAFASKPAEPVSAGSDFSYQGLVAELNAMLTRIDQMLTNLKGLQA